MLPNDIRGGLGGWFPPKGSLGGWVPPRGSGGIPPGAGGLGGASPGGNTVSWPGAHPRHLRGNRRVRRQIPLGRHRGLADRGIRRTALPAVAQQCHSGQQQCLSARQRSERAGGAARRPVRVHEPDPGAGGRGGQPGHPHHHGCGLAFHLAAGPAHGADRRRGARSGPVGRRPGRAAAGAVQRRRRRPGRADHADQRLARGDRQGRAATRAAGAPGRRHRHQRRPAGQVGHHRESGRSRGRPVHPGSAAADLPVAARAADHADPGVPGRGHLRSAGRRGGARRPEGLPARPAAADRAGPGRGHRLRPLPRVPGP